MLNLIRHSVRTFACTREGARYELVLSGKPKQYVHIEDGRTRVELRMNLSTIDSMDENTTQAIEAEIEQRLLHVMQDCQVAGVEPFGFAEKAATHFPTVHEWLDFDWRQHFSEAEVGVHVTIKGNN